MNTQTDPPFQLDVEQYNKDRNKPVPERNTYSGPSKTQLDDMANEGSALWAGKYSHNLPSEDLQADLDDIDQDRLDREDD